MDNSKQQLTIWNTVRSVSQHGQHGQQHLTTRTKQWLCHAMPVMPCDMPRATFLQLGFGMCENTFLSRRSPRTITDCRAGNIQGYIANQLNGFKCQMLTTWPKQWCYCKPSVLDQARSPVSVSTMLLWPWVSTKTPRINHHTLQESIGVKGGNGKSCDECSMLVPSVNLLDYFGGFPNEQRTAWYLNIDENPETARAMAFPSHTSPKGHGPFWIAEQNFVLRCGATAEKTYGFCRKIRYSSTFED